jgi:hypothetical protein
MGSNKYSDRDTNPVRLEICVSVLYEEAFKESRLKVM